MLPSPTSTTSAAEDFKLGEPAVIPSSWCRACTVTRARAGLPATDLAGYLTVTRVFPCAALMAGIANRLSAPSVQAANCKTFFLLPCVLQPAPGLPRQQAPRGQ